jgi:hypothetical protein
MSNDIVLRVIRSLEQLGIGYMLVGSYSSNAFGIARSTQDADFVIEIGDRQISALFATLAPDLTFDPQMRLESVTMTSRFVGRHAATGFKVELFLLSDDPFDRERFRRRQRTPFLQSIAQLPTPEDVIVQKLRWFKQGARAKDLEDAANILAVQQGKLDIDYMRRWADQHNTRETLDRLIDETSKLA